MNNSDINKTKLVHFSVNKDLEIKTIFEAVNSKNYGADFSKGLDFELVEHLKDRDFDSSKDFIISYVDNYYGENSGRINKRIIDVETVWGLVEKKVLDKIFEVTNKPFPHARVDAFMTLTRRHDYNYKDLWFKFSLNSNLFLVPTHILHELLHLHYYYYNLSQVLKELTYDESETLKESLTFLINLEFWQIVVSADNGYKIHEWLRLELANFWKTNRDYDKLTLEAIRLIKEHRTTLN